MLVTRRRTDNMTDVEDSEFEYEERAAILEYDAGMDRADAETRAREMCKKETTK